MYFIYDVCDFSKFHTFFTFVSVTPARPQSESKTIAFHRHRIRPKIKVRILEEFKIQGDMHRCVLFFFRKTKIQ